MPRVKPKTFLVATLTTIVFQFYAVQEVRAVTVQEAFKMSVAEFHALTPVEQADTIDLTLSAVHNVYLAKKKDEQAKCMKKLYQPAAGEKTSLLVAKIYEATGGSLGDLKVADVIIDVIETNCP